MNKKYALLITQYALLKNDIQLTLICQQQLHCLNLYSAGYCCGHSLSPQSSHGCCPQYTQVLFVHQLQTTPAAELHHKAAKMVFPFYNQAKSALHRNQVNKVSIRQVPLLASSRDFSSQFWRALIWWVPLVVPLAGISLIGTKFDRSILRCADDTISRSFLCKWQ